LGGVGDDEPAAKRVVGTRRALRRRTVRIGTPGVKHVWDEH